MPNSATQKTVTEWAVPLQIKKVNDGPSDSVTFTAWASIITKADGSAIIDHDGEIIKVADLESAVHKAALEGDGRGRGGRMHEFESKIDLLESMVVSHAKRAALGFGEGPEGWVVTCRSTDPETVKAIRSGEMLELSIRGDARREWVEAA